MNKTKGYIWDTKEQQAKPVVYGFSDLKGAVLGDYCEKRGRVRDSLPFYDVVPLKESERYSAEDFETATEFNSSRVIRTLSSEFQRRGLLEGKMLEHFRRVLKKAELKKLRVSYDSGFKNTSDAQVPMLDLVYLGVALGIHAQTRERGYLQSLSTLLKLNDFLVSERDNLSSRLEAGVLAKSLALEQEAVMDITQNIPRRIVREGLSDSVSMNPAPRTVDNLGMFVQETYRSKAYIQGLIRNGLHPNYVLLIKNQGKSEKLDALPDNLDERFFNPQFSEEEALKMAGIPYEVINAESCNEPQVVDVLKKRGEDFFVFSGRGILNKVFDAGKEIIHVHPGKLPEYRGSTCPYYSVLAGDGWWCTSFIMKPGIDEGEIVQQREFPLMRGVDASRIYDPYTRAAVLVNTVRQLADTKELKTRKQDLSEGTDYYTIHPVLEYAAKKFMDETGNTKN